MSGGQCVPSGHTEPVILTNNADLHVWSYTRNTSMVYDNLLLCLITGLGVVLLLIYSFKDKKSI